MLLLTSVLLCSAVPMTPQRAHEAVQLVDPTPAVLEHRAREEAIDGAVEPYRAPAFPSTVHYDAYAKQPEEQLAEPLGVVPPAPDLNQDNRPFVDRSQIYYVQENDGATWVRGATYKASASPSGFQFTPFLGADAPRNYPVGFQLTSATLEGRSLSLSDQARVSRSGDRFTLDRGAVKVRYDMALESVEQSFILEAAGAMGDLVLELEVTSDLIGRGAGAGFVFEGPSGGMTYGAAIVLDGEGRTASVPAQLEGTTLTLTVDHEFLAQASGPIVVDPILNTYLIDDASGAQYDLEVTYDNTSDTFLWVCEDQFSGIDTDIYVVEREAIDGTRIRGTYFEVGNANYIDPSVANLNSANRSLVVAQRQESPTTGEIIGRLYDYSNGSFGSEILIGDSNTQWNNRKFDVGGNSSSATDSSFFVVFSRIFFSSGTTSLRGRRVFRDGTLGLLTSLDTNSGYDTSTPSISESTGDASQSNVWNIAYVRQYASGTADSVRALQLNANGALVTPSTAMHTFQVGDTSIQCEVSDPIQIEGNEVYAISYSTRSETLEDTMILLCSGATRLNRINLHTSEHANLLLGQSTPRFATTRDEFLISYLERDFSGEFTAHLTAFDVIEGRYLAISERRTFLGVIGDDPQLGGGAPMASRFSGGRYSSRYTGIGWETGSFSNANVTGLTHFASNGDSPALQYCYGERNSTGDRGFIRMEGSRSSTSQKTLIAESIPPSAFGFFIVGDASQVVTNPGGSPGTLCVGGTVGRYSAQVQPASANGVISIPFDPTAISQPSGPITGTAGQFWQFTLWHRDTLSSQATFNFTNAISILLN